MPQRFLRPGITNSERFNTATFEEQSFYIRLLTIVDDFGRCDGRPAVLAGQLFSVWNEKHPESAVNPQRIAALSCGILRAGLIDIYEADSKTVIQILQWQERARSSKSKWPNPLRNPAESCGPLRSAAESCLPRSSFLDHTSSVPSIITPSENGSGLSSNSQELEIDSHFGENVQFKNLVSDLYNRPQTDRWSYSEEFSLAAVLKRPNRLEELEVIRKFKSSAEYFPQSIDSLLTSWQKTLDRARNDKPKGKSVDHREMREHLPIPIIDPTKMRKPKTV